MTCCKMQNDIFCFVACENEMHNFVNGFCIWRSSAGNAWTSSLVSKCWTFSLVELSLESDQEYLNNRLKTRGGTKCASYWSFKFYDSPLFYTYPFTSANWKLWCWIVQQFCLAWRFYLHTFGFQASVFSMKFQHE